MSVTGGNTEGIKKSFDNLMALLKEQSTDQQKIEEIKDGYKKIILYKAGELLKKDRGYPINMLYLEMRLGEYENLADYMGINMNNELRAINEKAHRVQIKNCIVSALKYGENYWLNMAETSAKEMEWNISSQINKVKRYSQRNAFSRKFLGFLYNRTGVLW